MQLGSSSRSGRNRGAAVEANAIEEQQLNWMQLGRRSQSGHNRGAVEIGEEQLKWKETGNSS